MKNLLSRRKWRKSPPNVTQETALDQPATHLEEDASTPQDLPQSSFPDGIEVLHDSIDATVDVCFVHGLTGDRKTTWTAPGKSTPWLKTLLPLHLEKARIITYGYDAYIMRKSVASSNRLIDHATNLLSDLTNDRSDCQAPSRPLIFVAHSLGGLVCKKAILLSRHNPEPHLQDVFQSTKGIIFMGTPHKGAWAADWAKIPISALGLFKSTNVMLLDVLRRDSQLLESIQGDFLAMVRGLRESHRGIEITCFFEELPLPVFGLVVSKDSATLEGYTPLTIHANHSDMVRFASKEDNGFKRLLAELKRWISQLEANRDGQQLPIRGQPAVVGRYLIESDGQSHLKELPTSNSCGESGSNEDIKGRGLGGSRNRFQLPHEQDGQNSRGNGTPYKGKITPPI
ncbi:uncharacterized protein N7483_007565 [Penicillium malachiteum]|uniref:uncharacterized protein n=1 Tax=Penicillium malachiteum TaxID=1324776 RepID=UPI002546BBA0|nr:uncharacterized protein N7483_007565 [Penicillium malachiteum]KAJ5726208.1 hypothetical protein N7483_007565 [Penicillium malachiteum]